jgi:hypothetical protein
MLDLRTRRSRSRRRTACPGSAFVSLTQPCTQCTNRFIARAGPSAGRPSNQEELVRRWLMGWAAGAAAAAAAQQQRGAAAPIVLLNGANSTAGPAGPTSSGHGGLLLAVWSVQLVYR